MMERKNMVGTVTVRATRSTDGGPLYRVSTPRGTIYLIDRQLSRLASRELAVGDVVDLRWYDGDGSRGTCMWEAWP